MSRGERNGQELHSGLFRGAPRFMVIAALARGYDVVPGVGSPEADRGDVVAGKVSV